MRGLSQLVEECRSAQFVCSEALRSDEFKAIVARFSTTDVGFSRPPLSETRKCFDTIAARKNAADYKPPKFTSADHVLERFTVNSRDVEIASLSPSPEDRLNALEAFAEYFVPIDKPATGLSPIDQNHASVVVSVRIDQEHILLGADLEQRSSPHSGWKAVVASSIRPQGLSGFFKVPHHGSSNGQSNEVWAKMLFPSAAAVVTPFMSSSLPRPEGLDWLKGKTSELYVTGLPTGSRIRRRAEVERTIKESTQNYSVQRAPLDPGVVRFRKSAGAAGSWKVETFGDAERL